MLRRLFVGIVIGLVIGGLVAAGLVTGLGMTSFPNPFLAYALAAATGVLTGLVAGKPIWAKGAQIEAGLKAVFGALLAAGAMFAVRKWLPTSVDLDVLHAGAGAIGDLPAASLPLVAAVLGGFYELDNTDAPEPSETPAKTRVAPGKAANARIASDDEADEESVAPAKLGKSKR